MSPIYLDYNATAPLLAETWQKLEPWFLNKFGNAASNTHSLGWQAADAVKQAREFFANHIGASDPSEIYFTSGATEGLNTALKGIWASYQTKGKHIVSVKTEHKAVLDTLQFLETQGADISLLDVNKNGEIDLQELANAIRKDTIAVCVMLANNETGVISNLKPIAEIVHQKDSILVCDATQALGKIPVNVDELGVDVLVFSGHKFYAMKGVGGMFVRRKKPRVKLTPLMHGGGHENGLRSGTLNVTGILSMFYSLQTITTSLAVEMEQQTKLRDYLEEELKANFDVEIVAHKAARLPNTTMAIFKNIKADKLITKMPDFAFSMGSACTSALPKPSHVLEAMGYSETESAGAIRVSIGRNTEREDLVKFVEGLKRVMGMLSVV